jgi:GntR family transcriptional regulator
MRILAGRIDGLLAEARQLGVSVEDVIEMVRKRERLMRVEVEKGEGS